MLVLRVCVDSCDGAPYAASPWFETLLNIGNATWSRVNVGVNSYSTVFSGPLADYVKSWCVGSDHCEPVSSVAYFDSDVPCCVACLG